ncbi:hypothetical protein EHW66_17355 [Erwinia psidii]|uniref:hypothetical protein n=1 Tax=Erwinia psidii TaxID=69224 RepID=UPI00226B3BEF|nr:hypothetical protein [Erwinia psidii]MCX8961143.1 hypothetical protein [Erwinia psidii]MCX8966685.1 hypothetical protein [Erwinia psidii]
MVKVNSNADITQYYEYDNATEYQQDLLDFIKKTQPNGNNEYKASHLNELIDVMKERYREINPNGKPTLSELNSTLLYVDSQLRKELSDGTMTSEQKQLSYYVENHLDKYASQLSSVNYLMNEMTRKALFPEESEQMEKY